MLGSEMNSLTHPDVLKAAGLTFNRQCDCALRRTLPVHGDGNLWTRVSSDLARARGRYQASLRGSHQKGRLVMTSKNSPVLTGAQFIAGYPLRGWCWTSPKQKPRPRPALAYALIENGRLATTARQILDSWHSGALA